MMQAQIEQHISYTSSSYHKDSPQTDCAKVNKISRKSCFKHKLTQRRGQLYHFDVYRLEDSSEFYEIGGDEYYENGICIIEWGEIIEDALPNDYIKIDFSRNLDDENSRTLNIQSIGSKYDTLVDSCKTF